MSLYRFSFFCLLVLMNGPAEAQRTVPASREIVVKFRREAAPDAVTTLSNALGGDARITPLNFHTPPSSVSPVLDALYIVHFEKNSDDPKEIIEAIERLPGVAYASLNHHIPLEDLPNDSLADRLYWIERIGAEEAWDVTTGSASVPIGIIDSGVDYAHPDLQSRIWHNAGEIGLDGLGRDKRSNDVDDDDNGFTDDWRGWDFVDTPGIEDGGDYLEPDNDPMDELGHGTAVAGTAAAAGNNFAGVVGLAYGSPIMIVRAGGASGFLQEDDAAQAIVYAAQNGARVINLSFGDVSYMPLLRDAIQYAYESGCVLVASAGNDNSASLHYPSGFDETLAVAATDEDDFKASFSNFGSSIDVAAPGVDIWSCDLGGGYRPFSGTSLSAPLVSALAALVLSHHGDFTNEQVRSVIETSSDDIGEVGWESTYGAGRINAFRALQIQWASVARITEPQGDAGTAADELVVMGTAAGALVGGYELFYGTGSNPATWTKLTESTDRQLVNDTIAVVDVHNFPESAHTLRLKVSNKDGSVVEDHLRFFVDRSAPVISGQRFKTMMSGPSGGYLIEYATNDVCDGRVWLRPSGTAEPFRPVSTGFRTKFHSLFVDRATFGDALEFYLEAENRSGLIIVDDSSGGNYHRELSGAYVGSSLLERDTSYHLSPLFLPERTTDLDQDGRRDFIVNEMDGSGNFLRLKILEYHPFYPGKFTSEWTYEVNGLPRDVSVGVEGSWLLVGAIGQSYIFKSTQASGFPTALAFHDTGDVWASRFLSVSPGYVGYLAKKNTSYYIRTLQADGSWPITQVLSNPTAGSNQVTLPGTAVGDFDDDGLMELLIGDYDGDLYIYEWNGQDFVFTWQDSLPLMESNGFLAAGDFDGNGRMDFVTGCHSEVPGDGSEPVNPHWLFRIYSTNGDNGYEPVWEQYYYGYRSLGDFQSGVTAADVDSDGRDDILIGTYPNQYLVRYDGSTFQTINWTTPCRTNAFLVDDINLDGETDVLYNTGEQTGVFGWLGLANVPPVAFETDPMDTSRIQLRWQSSIGAESYRVYRGTSDTTLAFLFSVSPFSTDTVDSGVINHQSYRYALTVVRNGLESAPAFSRLVRPNERPRVVSAVMSGERQVMVLFSEEMGTGLSSTSSYVVDGEVNPMTAVVVENGRRVLLTLEDLQPGIHTLTVRDLLDRDRTPMDASGSSVAFMRSAQPERFYVTGAEYLGDNRIRLGFSEPVLAATASMAVHYSMQPDFTILSAVVDEDDPARVILTVEGSYPIGAIGIRYIVIAHDIQSVSGKMLDETDGHTSSLVINRDDLSSVFVYPNPVVQGSQTKLMFANLTAEAVIRIYTVDGQYVRELTETDRDGGVEWNLKDRHGRTVGTGIYVYVVESGHMKKRGKFAVVK